ncbi:MAG: efflux RND transporter periplasmic adaptor subunit [Gemmatimonadales bacterium]
MRPAVAGVALLLLVACGSGKEGDPPASAVHLSGVPVGLGTIVRDSLMETVALTGRLEPRPGGSALLAAPAAGVVRTVRVGVGDGVHRAEVLVDLEVPELRADADQKATAAAQAERAAARQQQLLADGVTSTREAEEAAALARQATAAAAAARRLMGRTRVASPIGGKVQSVMVQPGERVDAGGSLVEVVATDTLDLAVPVPASDLPRLRLGLGAEVIQDGDTAAATGTLAALAPGVDSLTNAGKAVIRLPNPEGRLHPGVAATAHIRLGVRHDVLVAPDSALVLAGDSSVVFVVRGDSVVHQRVVRRGIHADGRTEVTGDLQAGDRVVTTGAFGLQDGMRVAPVAGGEPSR